VKAVVYDRYGPPQDLELRDLERPHLEDDGVLVRVRAASANPVDWHLLRGEPRFVRIMSGLRAPKRHVPGVDFAGEVEAVGAAVTEVRPGDHVFGGRGGSFAEYVSAGVDALAPKPAGLTWEQAAALPVAGCTALQALRDHGDVQPGQSVLVVGAAGGVGTFAVQIAKALGAEVTGVCSTRNLELVSSLGADHVVDYTVDDFTRAGRRYDLVLNVCGDHSLGELRRVLTPDGTLVIVGGPPGREESEGGLLGMLGTMLVTRTRSRFTKQRFRTFLAKVTRDDLLFLAELVEADALTPVMDRSYPLAEAAEALLYLEAGHARGKVAIVV
jgi:NADPH:quinone reductase-like Zn-dependent oxidoreductase